MRIFSVVALLILFLFRPAAAQTTDEIVSRGEIRIGVMLTLPPYGFLDQEQKPVGYDIDFANLLAKYLGVKANIVQLDGPARIPALLTGKVDVVIASFGITPERARQVWFSIPYSGLQNVVMARRGLAIKDFADLKGLRIGFPRGTVQDLIMTPQIGGTAEITRYGDDATTFQAMASGQVDAIAGTRVTIEGQAKAHPELDLEYKFTLLRQPNGVALRKGQTDLLQWINSFVMFVKVNGELNAISEKWLHEPLPSLPTF